MSIVVKFQERVKNDLDLEIFDFKRLYPGYWQRKGGAFSWEAKCKRETSGYYFIGSQFSVTELLKADKIDLYFHPITGDPEILPEKLKQ